MQIHSMARGVRATIVLLSAAGTLVAATIASASPVSAAANLAVQGQLQAFPVSGSYTIAQLFSGSDGQLWFATTHSQLGEIAPSGQATLTTTVLPHGAVPAIIAGAGPEGVWSYANDETSTTSVGPCAITLVTPTGVIEPVTLPSVAAPSACGGAATDASGNLWVSLGDPCAGMYTCGRRVSFVAEITPSRAVTLLPPARPGVRTGPVTLGTDGAIYAIGGTNDETMGRYTSSSVTTGIQIPGNDLIALLPSSGGTFWVADPKLCIGQPTAICLRIDRFAPGASTPGGSFIFPVAVSLGGPHQLAADSAGALWEAGGERSDPDRFFRMNTDGSIDRSTAFPAPGGSTLHADGTLAVSISGVLWASASAASGHEYLIRFAPTP